MQTSIPKEFRKMFVKSFTISTKNMISIVSQKTGHPVLMEMNHSRA